MSRFDSVVVGEEWISEHYLTSDATKGTFASHVTALRKQWDEVEALDKSTPRSGLRANATDIAAAIAGLGDDLPGSDPDDVRAVHELVRKSLGLDRSVEMWHSERSGAAIEVPDTIAHPSPTGTSLLILQAQPAHTVEEVLDSSEDGRGRLLTPATIDGKPEPLTTKVVSTVFLADDAPPFILIQAGRWAILAERSRWPEGRWLAVDLGLVAERRDVKKGGEIDHVATLLGRDTLLPDESTGGTALWTTILEESVQHTVGVSKDLREGIRRSVEIIANEVVERRREQGLLVEGVDGLAGDLSKQSLRFLYRILFLLYAEADPDLGVLPSRTEEYEQGYGLDRLRDLILVDLTSERSRNGTHIYDSLRKLFDLVDQGHESDDVPFHALRADLFHRGATSLIVEVKLGNEALQRVLRHLLLSKAKHGQDRGFISYAELGINQLGAVYEGLMSYSGFIADTDLYEVAPDGKPDKGTWVVPTDRADDIDAKDFVTHEDPDTGEPQPVIHRTGTFVYRLASRERQQSASYYTPEVLTRSVVKHSLAELLDQDDQRTPALDILNMTLCEPALGSGAFAIEAVRQLAAAYLERRQEELGEQIPAENYPRELQKVKAYLALHQVYGVDLNATAVELAEVSLWLDTMHAGLQAPWFGLHLRRGNSLIGARRAAYSPSKHFTKKAWLKTVPADVPLHDPDAQIGDGIHHFLLPAEGWGAAADTDEAKQYAPEKREQLREWRRAVRTAPTKKDRERLGRLAQRVETLWGFTHRRLEIAESEIRRHIDVWGAGDTLPESTGAVTREQIEKVLYDENGAYRRLRRVMDAWSALWFWPLTKRTVPGTDDEITPPTWDSWLGALEAILGMQAREHDRDRKGQLAFTADLDWLGLDEAEDLDRSFTETHRIEQAKKKYPWLYMAEKIANEHGFFHWDLDFAPVFARGGFDLQIGNPPWVRPVWDEKAPLAEYDPWWQLKDKTSESAKDARRRLTLQASAALNTFLEERSATAGLSAHFRSKIDRPLLHGLQPDSYRCFMDRSWRSMAPEGIAGLIHPDSHFTEERARDLRAETYPRLRRHWEFRNSLNLFEIQATRHFAVHIYGAYRQPQFLHAVSLHHPETIDRSLLHNGAGEPAGVKDPDGNWDLRAHSQRVIRVDLSVLSSWASLVDSQDTPPIQSRMIYPVNQANASAIEKLANARRLSDLNLPWTDGWHESSDVKGGRIEARAAVPPDWTDVVLQGTHITNATPLFKDADEGATSRYDFSTLDLENIGESYVPRTLYQRAIPPNEFIAEYPRWFGKSSSQYYRVAWREMCDPTQGRTLHSCIIPPGPTHLGGLLSTTAHDLNTLAVIAGELSSTISDFLIKVMGVGHVKANTLGRLPHVGRNPLEKRLVLRTLRLNCIGKAYQRIWEELFESSWCADDWVPGIGLDGGVDNAKPMLGDVRETWSLATPLRRDSDRRQALVEIDAIIAVVLNISADDLVNILRTQFPVLQEDERQTLYDAAGRQVPAKLATQYRKRDGRLPAEALTIDGKTYALPFLTVDREKDYRLAHEYFSRLDEERS